MLPDTIWFDVALILFVFAIGNIFFGHFEMHTPKRKRVAKVLFFSALAAGLSAAFGHAAVFALLGLALVFVVMIHAWYLPRHGINGLTGEPKRSTTRCEAGPTMLIEIFTDYTLRNVALGSALLGIVSGVLGCFAVLRRQGLLGDALAHAALPGICIAYLLTGSKTPIVLLLGAAVAGWVATLLLLKIVKDTRISEDGALGIVLSVFFAFGIVLLTAITKRNDANQSGLDKFLFGQAATLVEENVITMAILGGIALLAVYVLYKEFKLLAFDTAFAASLGFNTNLLSVLLTSLIVIAVVIGLQTVGVVLMAAMLVGPAVAARQWTNRLGIMIVLSAFFGAASGIAGALISVSDTGIPTGPMIILSMTAIVFVSLFFAPERGIVWDAIRQRQQRRELRMETQSITR